MMPQNGFVAGTERKEIFHGSKASDGAGQNPHGLEEGCRIHLTVDVLEDTGAFLDTMRSKIAEAAGQAAAKTIHATVRFKVTEVRELIAAP